MKEILKKVRKYDIAIRKFINNSYQGDYKSLFKGTGLDFEDLRLYNYGDDHRSINWKTSTNSYGSWSVSNQIDWHIVLAEMNGYDFNDRVLKPWVRDPAFYQSVWMYQSDVPGHEGPTNHGVLQFWMYDLPLSVNDKEKLKSELNLIPIFLEKAKKNLTW